MKIITDQDLIVSVTPELVAEAFANLDSTEQARFFNKVAEIGTIWDKDPKSFGFNYQLQAITDEDGLSLAGRRVMQEIGEYSHWGLVPRATYVPEE